MKRAAAFLISMLIFGTPMAARADDGRFRWGGDAEFGALVSPTRGERQDVAGLFTFQARAAVRAGKHWDITLGLGIPMPPAISVQVPLAIELRPWSAPFRFRAGARGILAMTDLCSENAADCPMESALPDPHQRGGWIVGVVGEAGVSYEWRLSHGAALRVAASYLGGPASGRRRNAETSISGYYQGAVMSIGVITR
jgi:hypothetical protein